MKVNGDQGLLSTKTHNNSSAMFQSHIIADINSKGN